MEYDTAVFDLDGTLLNTLEDLQRSTNYALRQFGYPERSVDEVKSFVGNGIMRLITLAVPNEKSDIRGVYDCFMSHYVKHCNDCTRPYDKIKEAIGELEKMGVKTAIVSNKNHVAVERLRDIYFPEISVAIGENEAEGVRKKPYPDAVELALKELGADKNRAVYIGDSEVDVKTAENCGMDCLSVSWGFRSKERLKESGAKVIVDSPEDLLKFFKKI